MEDDGVLVVDAESRVMDEIAFLSGSISSMVARPVWSIWAPYCPLTESVNLVVVLLSPSLVTAHEGSSVSSM